VASRAGSAAAARRHAILPRSAGRRGISREPRGSRRTELRLQELRGAASGCRDCPLWRGATQTVFGEGLANAPLMLVGEQPGDREDILGKPFVGPAGALLDRALEQAGIDPALTYTTNVVKHFKYRQRGKRRIHQRPAAEEISACRQWLDGELELIRPRVLVCLGATAAHALLGRAVSVERDRGRLLDSELAPAVLITAHPSSALRQRDSQARHAALAAITEDLRLAARELRPASR
jgi:uracil-DNA glycosylase